MKKLFNKKSKTSWFYEKIKGFLIKDSLTRISYFNRLKDYKQLLSINNKNLWNLHLKLEKICINSYKNNNLRLW